MVIVYRLSSFFRPAKLTGHRALPTGATEAFSAHTTFTQGTFRRLGTVLAFFELSKLLFIHG